MIPLHSFYDPYKPWHNIARADQELKRAYQGSGTCLFYPRLVIHLRRRVQLLFHATTAEALSSAQGEIEELAVSAEGEYR